MTPWSLLRLLLWSVCNGILSAYGIIKQVLTEQLLWEKGMGYVV